jgi:hypothetical protein
MEFEQTLPGRLQRLQTITQGAQLGLDASHLLLRLVL